MSEAGIVQQAFTIDAGDGLELRGDVRLIDDGLSKPILIVAHGFKGFKDWGFFPYGSRALAAEGFAVITFDFSCNGVKETDFDELERFGVNTYSREQADLTALLSAINKRELPFASQMNASSIFLLGHSRGGGNAVLFASEHPEVKGVVVWNGIANCNLFGDAFREEVMLKGVGYVANARTGQQMPIYSVFFEDLDRNRDRFDITAKAAASQTPTLFIQGDRDSERLLKGNAQLQEVAPHQTHVTLEGANHTFGAVHPFAGSTEHLEKAIQLSVAFLRSAASTR